jgi:hypothetical protein
MKKLFFASTPYGAISVSEPADVLLTEGNKGEIYCIKNYLPLRGRLSMRDRNTFILYSVLIAQQFIIRCHIDKDIGIQ